MLLQQLVNGVMLGSTYALIAIGYTLVFGVLHLVHLAHGEVFMIGAFIGVIMFTILGFSGFGMVSLAIVIVLLVSMAFTAAYGWAIERIAYRPLRGSFRLAPLISAIGASWAPLRT